MVYKDKFGEEHDAYLRVVDFYFVDDEEEPVVKKTAAVKKA